jgi:acetyl-CoA synthetase
MLERYLPKTAFSSYEEFYRDFEIKIPEGFNFAFDVVDEWARTEPGKIALVWCNDEGDEETYTYARLKELSDRAASFFKSQGIRKGDPVMLILRRRHEFWTAILGLHKLGAVAVPATHLLTVKDIVYRNNAADIRMIVTVADPDIMGRIDEAGLKSPSLVRKAFVDCVPAGATGSARTPARDGWLDFRAGLDSAAPSFPRPSGAESATNGDRLLLYFTSGTTGMPKMVAHDFAYPLGHLITAAYWQQCRSGGLHLTVADTGWAKAAWGKLYGQMLCGTAVFVYDYGAKFKPRDLLGVIAKYRLTSFCAPPTIYRYLIKEDLSKQDLSSLEHCSVAGEPLNPEVYDQWLAATGHKLMEGFGQTELVIAIATFKWMEPKPGSMGKPSPGYVVDLVDDAGRSCEAGEEGQIVLRTAPRKPWGIFQGYYRDEELTAKAWHGGLYYTGDMAWRDEDGYYWFVGRADDLIKSSGYRIGPFEVESALLEHPAVLECAVTGVPDPDRGAVVKATVVLAKGYEASDRLIVELQNHVKKVTAPYKYPRIVEFASELPKTISGKIRRVEIRSKDGDAR